jgi:signal transduction histidine kinase
MTADRQFFLSTLSAGRRERRLALAFVLVSVAIFLAAVPFATMQLALVPAFIPILETALVIIDLITAVLLYGQFNILRLRGLLVLASGFMFTAFLTVAHMLTFPGVFSPTGLLGAGPQSAAWLYVFWHGGFPLLVIAYALLKDERLEPVVSNGLPRSHASVAIFFSVAAVLVVVCGFTFFATAGQGALPAILEGSRFVPTGKIILSSGCILSALTLGVLWWRRPHTVLDLWLMVVMCVWILDTVLTVVLTDGRFDLGWYAGRIYGLLAASLVLIVLLIEKDKLYTHLIASHASERQERQLVQEKTAELMAVNKVLDTSLTEQKRIEAKLRAQSEEIARKNVDLEEASRAKSDFLANMSHELRTPLNSIIGCSEMLKDGVLGKLEVKQRGFVTDIFDAGSHLLSLINDILDLSKVEAGMLQLEPGAVNVLALLKASALIVREKALALRIRFDTQLDPALGTMLADERKLKQIVYNLLSNAVKFVSEDSAVTLRARRCARAEVALDETLPGRLIPLPPGDDNEFLAITVEDTGVGIAEEDLPKLFEPFTQVDSSAVRRQGGTGLGLSLVRSLAELHGGTVGVASRLGIGSCFCVWLPYHEAVPAMQEGKTTPESTAPSAPAVPFALVIEEYDRLAELHGGMIEVQSEPGESSTFTLGLPIKEKS